MKVEDITRPLSSLSIEELQEKIAGIRRDRKRIALDKERGTSSPLTKRRGESNLHKKKKITIENISPEMAKELLTAISKGKEEEKP